MVLLLRHAGSAHGCKFPSFVAQKCSSMVAKARIDKRENVGVKTLGMFIERNHIIYAWAQRQSLGALPQGLEHLLLISGLYEHVMHAIH